MLVGDVWMVIDGLEIGDVEVELAERRGIIHHKPLEQVGSKELNFRKLIYIVVATKLFAIFYYLCGNHLAYARYSFQQNCVGCIHIHLGERSELVGRLVTIFFTTASLTTFSRSSTSVAVIIAI